MRFLLVLVGLTVAVQGAAITSRCDAEEPDDQERRMINDGLVRFRQNQPAGREQLALLEIPIIFHVIYKTVTSSFLPEPITTGLIPEATFDNQVEILNTAFRGRLAPDAKDTGMEFYRHSTIVHENAGWFDSCKTGSYTFRPQLVNDTNTCKNGPRSHTVFPARRPSPRTLEQKKANLFPGAARSLTVPDWYYRTQTDINVFTCSGDGYLGWTWLPWTHGEGSNFQALVMNYESMPGFGLSRYDEGFTLVHEMGHYFGLLHTFQRGTCTEEGDDGVADTPLESRSASDCGADHTDYTRDTCTSDPGADPIWSFMDYSYDLCMKKFSDGQVDRIVEMMELHRPNLRQASFVGWADGSAAQPVATGRPTSPPTGRPTNRPTGPPTNLRPPTGRPTNRPTGRPTRPTGRPTNLPTRPPTDPPTIAASNAIADVRFVSVPTEITPGTQFSIVFGFSCSNMEGQPLAIKVAVYDENMLWVGGTEYATIPFGELTGSRMVDVTLHGTPVAADTYTIRIFALQLGNVPQDGSMPSETLDLEDRQIAVLGAVTLQSACVTLMSAQTAWKFQARTAFPRVCSGSKDLAGDCFGELSYAETESACAANGARICSLAELDAGVARNTGCGYNSFYTWTTDTCEGGHIITGAIDSPDLQPQCIGGSANNAQRHQVRARCCADDVGITVPHQPQYTAAPTRGPTEAAPACSNTCLVASCTDATCERWATTMGFCDENSLYHFWMAQNCPLACGICSETNADIMVTPAPTMNPTDALTPCETHTADVKERCDDTNCCSGETMVCTVKKNRGRRWCLVEHPPSSSKYDIGEPCFKHNQCDTRYCDKGGNYGIRFRCAAPRTKSQASSQEADTAEQEGDIVLTAMIIVIGLAIIIGAAIVVIKYTRPVGNYNFMGGPASSSYQTSNSISTLSSDTKSATRQHMPTQLKKEWERQSQAESLNSAIAGGKGGTGGTSSTGPTTIHMPEPMSGVARVIADVKKVHNMARQPKPGVAAYMDEASQCRDESRFESSSDSRSSTTTGRDMTGNHQQLVNAARALCPPNAPAAPTNAPARAVYL